MSLYRVDRKIQHGEYFFNIIALDDETQNFRLTAGQPAGQPLIYQLFSNLSGGGALWIRGKHAQNVRFMPGRRSWIFLPQG